MEKPLVSDQQHTIQAADAVRSISLALKHLVRESQHSGKKQRENKEEEESEQGRKALHELSRHSAPKQVLEWRTGLVSWRASLV